MSAEKTPKKPTDADADRKRKRRNVAIGVGAGIAGATLIGLLLFSSSKASAAPLDAPPRKSPEKAPKKGSGKGSKTPGGGGGSGGGGSSTPDEGGSRGPGGDTPSGGGGRRTSPDTGPRRTSPDVTPDDGPDPRRTSPDTGPVGPDPRRKDLPDYYNDENPDPGKFYQVTAGGNDAKGLFNIARRYAVTSLYLAAVNVGGLSQDEAIAWASARSPDATKVREWADYILCVAWNDIVYGSNRVSSNNYRGPHGRGIPLSPMHADNWARLIRGDEALRNVYMHEPGDEGTPSNAGRGDRKLPLLWMPQLDERVLWESDGQTLRAGGSWADGSSFFFPPPIVADAAIDDPTGAQLGVWGCGDGSLNYG